MDYINLKARAKINISLDILGKREDGYHDLSMLMQSVNLADNIFIRKNNTGIITVSSNLSWLPTDRRNLVYRAAEEMINRYDLKTGIHIDINKVIPVCAGLAGGSSDCAAALVGIRNLFRLPVSNEELMAVGKGLGADVPFCIMRGTALAEGIGERLTPIAPFPKCSILIAKPPINVSTAAVFKAYSSEKAVKHPDNEKIIDYIKNKDLKGICSEMCNVLETVTIADYPIISDLKKCMLDNGAIGSMMSGSGPTVFGIFPSSYYSNIALKAVKRNFSIRECYVTTAFNIFDR